MTSRPVLRAHQLRSVGPRGRGPGSASQASVQKWLVEREWLSDGRVMQRINEGKPILEDDWRETARWSDLEAERAQLRADGWEIDPS